MSPQQAAALVGHSPDIVATTRLLRDAQSEIDRLRAIISRVRHLTAYTDAEWAMGEIREFLEENT
jgi:hypothetical protein